MNTIYRKERDFIVCNTIGVCALTRKAFMDEVFSVPTNPICATVDFIGIPAIISARENEEYARIYEKATVAAIDGMPIVKMGLKKGYTCERCAGPDIMGLVFEEGIKRNKTHYFYGGKDKDVLRKLKANLEQKYDGIRIVGMYSPPFRNLTDEEDKKICDEINQVKPDFIWVGIGAPKQEKWMQEHREKIQGAVMLGVGAGFNFFAGTLKKAPAWMENASLEWLYRLTKEPKRLWKRYILGGIKFLYYYAESSIKSKKSIN